MAVRRPGPQQSAALPGAVRALAPAGVLCLVLAAAGPAASQAAGKIAIDEARVEALIEACGARGTESYLAERVALHRLADPGAPANPATELAVDRALDPAHNPEQAAAALAEVWQTRGAADPRAVRVAVLRNFAYFEALNCKALKQWYGHVLVYGDLAQKARSDDVNRDYYDRSLVKFRTKLAIALKSRARLREKEQLTLAVVGLGAP